MSSLISSRGGPLSELWGPFSYSDCRSGSFRSAHRRRCVTGVPVVRREVKVQRAHGRTCVAGLSLEAILREEYLR